MIKNNNKRNVPLWATLENYLCHDLSLISDHFLLFFLFHLSFYFWMQGDQRCIKSLIHIPWIRLCNTWPCPTWPLHCFCPKLLPSMITITVTSPTPCIVFLVTLPLSYDQTLTLYILPHLGEGNQPIVLCTGVTCFRVFEQSIKPIIARSELIGLNRSQEEDDVWL